MTEKETIHIGTDDCWNIILTDPYSKSTSIMYNDEFIVFASDGELTENIIMNDKLNLYIHGELTVKQIALGLFNRERK